MHTDPAASFLWRQCCHSSWTSAAVMVLQQQTLKQMTLKQDGLISCHLFLEDSSQSTIDGQNASCYQVPCGVQCSCRSTATICTRLCFVGIDNGGLLLINPSWKCRIREGLSWRRAVGCPQCFRRLTIHTVFALLLTVASYVTTRMNQQRSFISQLTKQG